jgi:RNA polymerase sigma-B factor
MTRDRDVRARAPSDWRSRDLKTLFSCCSAGDARARETIIVRFLPLARGLARTYEGRGEPVDDLRQAASVGLIKAVDRYSPDRGDAFPAYARPMIVGEIRRHFRDTTWPVHVPRPMKERAARVVRASKELPPASGLREKTEALANHLGLAVGEVADAQRAMEAYWPESFDATSVTPDRHRPVLSELIGDHEPEYERVELSVGIQCALRALGMRDRKVLLMRLAFELTQDEIAGHVGVSQMQVSRILRNAGAALTAACGLA